MYQTIFQAAARPFSKKRMVYALALAVAVHFFVWASAPKTIEFLAKSVPAEPMSVELAKNLDVPAELLPEEFRKKPNFVLANPDSPNREPIVETENEAAADQRAAQENPDVNSRSRTPTVDGEIENSSALNDRVAPRELLPPETVVAPQKKRPAGTPISREHSLKKSDAEKIVAEQIQSRLDSAGTVAIGEDSPGVPDMIEGVPAPETVPQMVVPAPGVKMLLLKSNSAANELGVLSLDARFSEFAEYTQRLLETIQASWWQLCENRVLGEHGRVVVRFVLNRDGEVLRSEILESSASDNAAYACRDAIESRAPFEPWPTSMVDVLGDEDVSVITFHYR